MSAGIVVISNASMGANHEIAPINRSALQEASSVQGIQEEYTEIFNQYTTLQDNLLKQLNDIFGLTIAFDSNRHVSFTVFIQDVCNDCDAANEAYKFYGRQIIEQINELGNYILKAREWLQKLEKASDATLKYIADQLEILRGFCGKIADEFSFRYAYDFNEDVWKSLEDDYRQGTHTQINKPYPKYTHDDLRKISVDAYPSQGVAAKKTIEVFNELNLLDRLTYIKIYYDKTQGKTDLVFPSGKSIGFPCEPQPTDTILGALEPFFMGYLIDRDGPVNAMSSFLEVKATALLESIRLETQKIKTLNVYLKFLNRALDILNESQSTAKNNSGKSKTQHRIPDGVTTALSYLCGGTMYNLFEKDGQEYLVLESNYNTNNCFLVKADESGMRFLIGDNAMTKDAMGNICGGNSYPYNYIKRGNVFTACIPSIKEQTPIETSSKTSNDVVSYFWDGEMHQKVKVSGFKLPSEIVFEKIVPGSVRKYTSFFDPNSITTDVVTSWTKAFRDKVSFVNTNLETLNTDIKFFRNKMDSLTSLSNIFRNRTYNAYARVTANMKK